MFLDTQDTWSQLWFISISITVLVELFIINNNFLKEPGGPLIMVLFHPLDMLL